MCLGFVKELCWRFIVTYLSVQKEADEYSYGLFAVVLAANISNEISSMETQFNVTRMRGHFISCLVNERFSPFPKNWSKVWLKVVFHELYELCFWWIIFFHELFWWTVFQELSICYKVFCFLLFVNDIFNFSSLLFIPGTG